MRNIQRLVTFVGFLLIAGCSQEQIKDAPDEQSSSSGAEGNGSLGASEAATKANEKLLSDIAHYPEAKEVKRVTKRHDFRDIGRLCSDITTATFKVAASDVDQSMVEAHYVEVFDKKGWRYRPGIVGGPDAGKYLIGTFESGESGVTLNTEGFTEEGEYTLYVDAGVPC